MTGRGRRRHRLLTRLVVAASVVAAGGATAAVSAGLELPNLNKPPTPRSELPPETVEVIRETLVDTQNENGELGYGDTTTVRGRLAGALTWLPAVGSVVKRGQTLYRVNDTPVALLYGSLPVYRDLKPGIEGRDVKQFEQNLHALGYRGFTVDEEYTDYTAEAVEEWQEDLGLEENGTVELGRVIYARGVVRVDSHQSALGDALQPGAEVLDYTGTGRLITVELDLSDRRLTSKQAVTVRMPDGRSISGRIVKTQTMVDTGDSDSGGGGGDSGESETKLEVTVAVKDQKALAGLDDASVHVAFTASQRQSVLTVPVAALLALAEGGYGLEVVEGGTSRIVVVETGLFASGRVEVSGDGLREGMKVGIPS